MSDNNWLKEKLEKMDAKLDRTDERLDKFQETLTEQAVTLGKQSIILEDHTRRSLANEEAVEMLKNELKPIQKERYMIKGGFKVIGTVIAILSILGTIGAIINWAISTFHFFS